jgi:hypothetical protein
MNIPQLFEDFSIPYYSEGFKYCRTGWINVDCPFCGTNTSSGPHLGFEIANPHFHCWSCGFHSVQDTISAILNVEWYKAKEIIAQYGGQTYVKFTQKEAHHNTKPHKLPSNTTPLQKNHRRYLEMRNFDPEYLERVWHLVGTGPISLLGDLNYKHRIVIPYIWNGRQVSFDARDITGKAINKYQACPLEREIIPHKDILYGKQETWKETGICVEGTTDVWRLGVNAFATSGIAYTPKQLRIIAKTFKRVAVVFDSSPKIVKSLSIESIKENSNFNKEKQAEQQAKDLIAELRFRGIDAFRVPIVGDPASMSQSEADYIVKQIIK